MNPAKAREAVGRIKEDRESFMLAVWAFLRPTKLKMLFLAEWSLYLLIELFRGKLGTAHHLIVAGYPLLFFYLIGCTMAALAGASRRPPRWRHLLGLAALLVVSEQVVKAAVNAFIPWKASIPIIPGWLHLAHGVRNTAAGLRYVLYVFLSELDRPERIIHRPGGYFMAPLGGERVGDVSNVLFCNGWVERNGEIFIYYASSDTRIHVATTTVDKMLDYVLHTPEDPGRSYECVVQRRSLIEKNLRLLAEDPALARIMRR